MVNQTVYEYLKNYKDKFSVEELKNEILKKGYDETDFNEALSQVNLEGEKRINLGPVKKLPSFDSVQVKSPKKSKILIWIILFILVFDIALFLLLNFFGFDFFGINLFG